MHFHFSFYSSILLIFFSQGITLSVLLCKKSLLQSSKPNAWLSLFTFLCSLYILPWMLGFAGWYSLLPYRDIMFYSPFQQLLLLGPVIYFYTQSLLNPHFAFTKKQWLHFLPAGLYIIYRFVIFLTDKIILHRYYFYANGRDKSLDTWYQIAGVVSMLIYFLLSLRYYAIYKKLLVQTVSFADTLLFVWIKKYLLSFLVMQMLWVLFFFLYPGWGDFKGKWWYYVAFSSVLYYIGITGYANNVKSVVPFRLAGAENKVIYLLENTPPDAANEEMIQLTEESAPEANEATEEWKAKIAEVMEAEKLYQNPTLTLADVAKRLGTNPTLVSRMVNQGFGMNFNDFINTYRTKAVIAMLRGGVHKQQTLLGISIDCGFNSKTTFNRYFKKFTGLSPKEFIQQLENGRLNNT